MPQKPKALVLDSWAVIAYFEDEPAGQEIADSISSAHEESIPVFMSVVNIGEVWYITAHEISGTEADTMIKELRDLRIQFVDANWELTLEAVRFKSLQKISYADCYAAVLAKIKGEFNHWGYRIQGNRRPDQNSVGLDAAILWTGVCHLPGSVFYLAKRAAIAGEFTHIIGDRREPCKLSLSGRNPYQN